MSIGQGEPVADGQRDRVPRGEEPPAPWLLPGHRLLPAPQGQGALGGWPPRRTEPCRDQAVSGEGLLVLSMLIVHFPALM